MALHRKDDFRLLVYAYDIRRMSVGRRNTPWSHGMLIINIHELKRIQLCVFGIEHIGHNLRLTLCVRR